MGIVIIGVDVVGHREAAKLVVVVASILHRWSSCSCIVKYLRRVDFLQQTIGRASGCAFLRAMHVYVQQVSSRQAPLHFRRRQRKTTAIPVIPADLPHALGDGDMLESVGLHIVTPQLRVGGEMGCEEVTQVGGTDVDMRKGTQDTSIARRKHTTVLPVQAPYALARQSSSVGRFKLLVGSGRGRCGDAEAGGCCVVATFGTSRSGSRVASARAAQTRASSSPSIVSRW